MRKRVPALLILLTMSTGILCNCAAVERSFGTKPAGFDDPMPELWEEVLFGTFFDISAVDVTTVTRVTIGNDVTNFDTEAFTLMTELEAISVASDHQVFASDDGVLYSKSLTTLYRWPKMKPVTEIKNSVKYFAPNCFDGCLFSEGFKLPEGTITIGGNAFLNSNLSSLRIGQNVQAVGSWAYSINTKNHGFTNDFPMTCKTIIISAPIVYTSFFVNSYETQHLESLVFEAGVTEIRSNTNADFPYVRKVTLPATLEAIGSVRFPVNISVLEYSLLENVSYLETTSFSDYYPEKHFFGCSSLVETVTTREVNTIFITKTQIAEDYVALMMPKWERTRQN
ncbi:MAG: leucine-rich repeat domain-containing protein [Erysipelotrichaceae bacterium]|nr:leucine-rich repeat domain-containing protein [Erysipelotrichaceae bacterium]